MAAVILCGFMGCGKTTVGRLLAQKLGWQFVDVDQVVEENEGRTVSRIFADEGEPAFRCKETEACRFLATRQDCVIAAGGGTVLDPENVRLLKKAGPLVYLKVTPQTVISRLGEDTTRPLLQRPDKLKAVTDLLAQRESSYLAAAEYTVDGSRSPAEVATEIEKLFGENA